MKFCPWKHFKMIMTDTLKILIFFLILTSIVSIKAQESKSVLPKPNHGNTYVVAHRGVHLEIPENTLAAYQKAIDLGCDFIEIDVRSTKDGKLISIHNSTVDSYVQGVSGKVNDFTLAELKALDIGSRIGLEWKHTRIPTIEEIFQLCQGRIGIYLDLKEPLVEELIVLIKKYKMEADILWYIPRSYMDEIIKIKKLCAKCIPMPDPGKEKNLRSLFEKVNPIVIAPVMNDFSETYVRTAHAYGVKVIVDEDKGNAEEWNWILNLGTDGIQTDNPMELIKYLKKRN